MLHSLTKRDGTFTNSKVALLEVHYSGEFVVEVEGRELVISANLSTKRFCNGNWDTTRAIATNGKVRAAI